MFLNIAYYDQGERAILHFIFWKKKSWFTFIFEKCELMHYADKYKAENVNRKIEISSHFDSFFHFSCSNWNLESGLNVYYK